jgi:hypothetical protein
MYRKAMLKIESPQVISAFNEFHLSPLDGRNISQDQYEKEAVSSLVSQYKPQTSSSKERPKSTKLTNLNAKERLHNGNTIDAITSPSEFRV